jgi:hypothetical protein
MVLDVGLERVDGPGSPFAYDTVGVIVGRRCGKTVTTMGVPLVRALAGPVLLPNGRRVPFGAAHTAQNLTAARKRFLVDLVEPYKTSMTPARWARTAKLYRNINNTTLTLDPFGRDVTAPGASSIQVYAPTPSSVRGEGLLSLTFDEALVFKAEEGEALMGSARPVMSEFGGLAQMYVVSNISAQTSARDWIVAIRDRGRGAAESGRTSGLAYFEWSPPKGADPLDERQWWAHYPALGDGIVGVDQLRRDLEELGVESFGAEYLGMWPDEGGPSTWRAFDEAVWRAAATTAEIPADAPIALGVEIDPLGRDASIVAATVTSDDGAVLVEVLASGPDTRWLRGALRALADGTAGPPPVAIAVNDYGAGHGLLVDLADEGLPFMPLGAKDYPAACFDFETGIGDGSIRYRVHEALDEGARHAKHSSGRAWAWESRVAVSSSSVGAATLGAWAIRHAPSSLEFFVY